MSGARGAVLGLALVLALASPAAGQGVPASPAAAGASDEEGATSRSAGASNARRPHSLMFTFGELAAIRAARGGAPARIEDLLVATERRTENGVSIEAPALRMIGDLHLSAVTEVAAGDWRIWLNGAAHGVGDAIGGVTILGADPRAVRLAATIGGQVREIRLALNQTLDLSNGRISEGAPAIWRAIRLR